MKNGLELANERMYLVQKIDEKLNKLTKAENITERERIEKDIDRLEELLHDNKKLLEQLK